MVRLARRVLGCGAAFALIALGGACTDPVPPPAQGTGAVNIAGTMCPTTGPVAFTDGPVTGSTHTSLVDGTKGAQVSCAVSPGASGTFNVSGRIIDNGSVLSISNLVINPANPTSRGEFSASAFNGGLSVSGGIPDGSAADMSDCEFSVMPTGSDTALAIGSGRVWMSMSCTKLNVVGDAGGRTCDIKSGYFVFENCSE